jgi:hypothetical protein
MYLITARAYAAPRTSALKLTRPGYTGSK